MSLTKEQWEEMWKATKELERYSNQLYAVGREGMSFLIQKEVNKIKRLIESVVGQKE